MFLRTLFDQFLPPQVRSYIIDALKYYWKCESSDTLTLVFEEKDGRSPNDMFNSTKAYLCTIISPDTKRIRITKNVNETHVNIKFAEKQGIVDSFEGISITWNPNPRGYKDPGVNLDHPSTFDALAMDPIQKKAIIDDLDLFVRMRDFYMKVGKAWKRVLDYRWYLLYGPPGTGKSSLIAAMANYLKFDVYDLQLMNIRSDSILKDMMLQTSNRSILVIEDIDCSTNIPDQNRTTPSESKSRSDAKFSLSWLLNFIDGYGLVVTPVKVAGELMKSDNAEVILDGLVKFLEDTGTAPKQQQQVIPQTTCYPQISNSHSEEDEYDKWADGDGNITLSNIDNVLKVIQNGKLQEEISKLERMVVIRILPPVTVAEIQAIKGKEG
ncbi:AAA-ATPase-like protein [Tanacetum coccineum]